VVGSVVGLVWDDKVEIYHDCSDILEKCMVKAFRLMALVEMVPEGKMWYGLLYIQSLVFPTYQNS